MRWSEAEAVVRAYRAERGADVGEVRRFAQGHRSTEALGLGAAWLAGPRLLRRAPALAGAPTRHPSTTILTPDVSPRLAVDGTSKDGDATKIVLGGDLEREDGTLFRNDEPL